VDWDTEIGARRAIAIKVLSRDEPGMLAKVTNTISAAGINIGSARVSTGDSTSKGAEQSFELWVQDVQTLNTVMREIRKVRGVRSVERVRG
jgi:guanosine-3',5'-bis(diphosphate) 3'-pyrophosphohydrolase